MWTCVGAPEHERMYGVIQIQPMLGKSLKILVSYALTVRTTNSVTFRVSYNTGSFKHDMSTTAFMWLNCGIFRHNVSV